MFVTISLPRILSTLKSWHGLDPATTDDEILVRLDLYAKDFFNSIRTDYGVSVGQLVQEQGSLGVFQVDISATRRGTMADWTLLIGGLSMLSPVCVSLAREDVWILCDGLVGKAVTANWSVCEAALQRLSLDELHPHFEAWCGKLAWGNPEPQPWDDPDMKEIETRMRLDECGVPDPLAKHHEQQEYNRLEIEAEQERQRAGNADWAARFGFGN